MINNIDTLTFKLDKLYKMYEEKCWNDIDNKIIILLADNTITFYYNCGKENIDEFCLSFVKKERKIYKYLALTLFEKVLGDVYIYKEGNSFYNLKHKAYLNFIVNDEELLLIIKDMVFKQNDIFIKEKIDEMYQIKPFKIYSSKFLKKFDERLDISMKRIRRNNK